MPQEPWGVIGDRNGRLQAADLRRVIAMSVVGRNMLNGTQDSTYFFDADPTGTVGSWPDGAEGVWASGANLVRGTYTRATGWKSTTLT